MNDTVRYLIAGILIFLIIILQPFYLEWLGYDPNSEHRKDDQVLLEVQDLEKKLPFSKPSSDTSYASSGLLEESFITISSPLYTATITNYSGGSLVNYIIKAESKEEKKYIGGYNDDGLFVSDLPVSLLLPFNSKKCMPCLASFNERTAEYLYFNKAFTIDGSFPDTIFIGPEEHFEIKYSLKINKQDAIQKSLLFSGNEYVINHHFSFNRDHDAIPAVLEVLWDAGLRPTEEKENEDVQYGSGIISQAGEIEDVQMNGPNKNIERQAYKGKTDWVAIRSKYFISALIANTNGNFATLSAKNFIFGTRKHTPIYSASIGIPFEDSSANYSLYLGPLDIDHLSVFDSGLDVAMNWGFAIIRPISKGILWVLKFMHNTFHINYGIVLLLFALLIRFITGPLTKKSFESSQNMQKIQPELKKIQSKFKGDPQGLNRETMALYKKHNVNPLGGCLPILLQMPLLWALFIVFRTTIEFRGAPFMLWITDLSKPDIVFSLPFSIPIYGDGVALLPIIMGATLILTMRMSTATMDSSQKPVMYFMNIFFVLLFNTFPSGLNLYYTAYNILSFFQQRNIRALAEKK